MGQGGRARGRVDRFDLDSTGAGGTPYKSAVAMIPRSSDEASRMFEYDQSQLRESADYVAAIQQLGLVGKQDLDLFAD